MNQFALLALTAFITPMIVLSLSVRHRLAAFAGVDVDWVVDLTAGEKIYPERSSTRRHFAVPLLGYLDRGRLHVITRNGEQNAYAPYLGRDVVLANSYGDFLVQTYRRRGPVRVLSYDGQLKWRKEGFGAPRILAGGRFVALFDRQHTGFRIFSDTSKALTPSMHSDAFITDMSAALSGQLFAYATIRGECVLFNSFRILWKYTATPPYRNPVTALALSPDGRYAAVVFGHPDGSRLVVFDVRSKQQLWRMPLGRHYIHRTALRWLPDHVLVFEAADGVHAFELPRKRFAWRISPAADMMVRHVRVSRHRRDAAVALSSLRGQRSRVYLFRENRLHSVMTLAASRVIAVIRQKQLFLITPDKVSGVTIRPLAEFQEVPEQDRGDEFY